MAVLAALVLQVRVIQVAEELTAVLAAGAAVAQARLVL